MQVYEYALAFKVNVEFFFSAKSNSYRLEIKHLKGVVSQEQHVRKFFVSCTTQLAGGMLL